MKRPAPAEPVEAPAPKRRTRNAKLEALKKQMAEDKKKHPHPTFSDESSEEDSGQDDDYSQSSDDDREPVPEVRTSFPDLSKTAPHGTPGTGCICRRFPSAEFREIPRQRCSGRTGRACHFFVALTRDVLRSVETSPYTFGLATPHIWGFLETSEGPVVARICKSVGPPPCGP